MVDEREREKGAKKGRKGRSGAKVLFEERRTMADRNDTAAKVGNGGKHLVLAARQTSMSARREDRSIVRKWRSRSRMEMLKLDVRSGLSHRQLRSLASIGRA